MTKDVVIHKNHGRDNARGQPSWKGVRNIGGFRTASVRWANMFRNGSAPTFCREQILSLRGLEQLV
jgi:hypothetical protein